MTPVELKQAIKAGKPVKHGFTRTRMVDGNTCIGRRVALKVAATSSAMPLGTDIPIKDTAGALLGVLCIRREITPRDLSSLTDEMYTAYLADVDPTCVGSAWVLRTDYVIVQETRYDEYKKQFKAGSAVWGGFYHGTGSLPAPVQMPAPMTIIAQPSIHFPTPFHEETAQRAMEEPRAFERFLKLYHLLELNFDLTVVREIKHLGSDLKGIGRVLAQYGKTEIDRLRDMVRACRDTKPLENCLNAVMRDAAATGTAEAVFFQYHKKDNPFGGETDALPNFRHIAAHGGFVEPTSTGTSAGAIDAHRGKIREVSVFWIYRVRCSIAHNRIGEYVMTAADESFVALFMEPLLREVLKQVYRKRR